MIDINQFKSAVHKHDLERPNLYAVKIGLPRTAPGGDGGLLQAFDESEKGRILTLFCKSTTLPGVAIGTADAKRYSVGPTHKMPAGIGFTDISMTFLCDASGITYNVFYQWLNTIIPFSDGTQAPGNGRNFQLEFKKNYESDITIEMYRGAQGKFAGAGMVQMAASVISAATGTPFIGALLGGRALPQYTLEKSREVTMYKAYPTSISEMTVSSVDSDQIAEFTVGFTFYNWSMKRYPSTSGGSNAPATGDLLANARTEISGKVTDITNKIRGFTI